MTSSPTFQDAEAALELAGPPAVREFLAQHEVEQHVVGFHDQATDPRACRPLGFQAAAAQADAPDAPSMLAAFV
jgi:hypothetical protein